jgi:tetratricopeptide (TPR) repeat protein
MAQKKPTSINSKIKPTATLAKPAYINHFLDNFAEQTIWHWFILALLPFFIYIKTTGFQFIDFDDVAIIKNNYPILSDIKNIGWAFKTDAFLTTTGDFYRPMQTVVFFIDAFIGGERPWIYHLSNVLLHILTVLALYSLLKKLGSRNLTALFIALIFSVHPLLSSAVSWIPATGDLLIGLFGVLLFLNFIKYTQTFSIGSFILNVLLFLLALFSKETAVLFPVILLLYYWLVSKETFKLKKIVPLYLVWIICFAFFYFLRSKVVINTPPDFIVGINPFINNLPAIPISISKFLFPVSLSTMPLFEAMFTFFGMLLLIVFLFVLLKFIRLKKWLPVFGFVWFIVFIIPPMFFKLYYSNFLLEYYEHRLYLPIAGLMILLAFVLDDVLHKKAKRVYYFMPIAIVFLFSFMALNRSDDFKDSIAFFTNATNHNNAGACQKRGELYLKERDFNSALADFEQSIELSDQGYAPAFYYRGIVRSEQGKDHVGAEQDFSKAIGIDSIYIEAYINRASERIHTQNIPGAFEDLDKAKQYDSSNPKIYATLGKIYVSTSDFANAKAAFTKTILIDSFDAETYNNRAFAKYRLQEYYSALEDCNKATNLFPQFMNAYYNKGMIFLELKKPETAIKTFDTTLALADNFYFGYFYRGVAKKQMSNMKGACEDWQQSVNLGFNMAQDTINKYCGK